MADTPTGETANPGDSQTTVTTSATPPQVNAVDPAEVERLRKEAEQARMRANQLENELKKKAEAEEAARQKQLEEQNEWKQIAEQERAKREAYEKEREEAEVRQQLEAAQNSILSQFSTKVQEIAKETGISLNEASDDAQENFKKKLQRLSDELSTTTAPSANNPAPSNINPDERLRLIRNNDPQARFDAISNLEAVKAMRAMSGYDNPN